MADSVRPPTKDEVQYARDVIRGRRPVDLCVIVGSAVLGAALGVPIAIGGLSSEGLDMHPALFVLTCVLVCAACLAVIAGLILSSVRSIRAMCAAWLPARVIAVVACVYLGASVLDSVSFALVVGPGSVVPQLVMKALFLVFFVPMVNAVTRVAFVVWCMVTGRDDEEIIARNIAADGKREESSR